MTLKPGRPSPPIPLAQRAFRHTAFRYLFGLGMVAGALGLRLLISPWTGTGAPFVLFFGAVLVTSLVAGLGPSLLALFVSLPLGAVKFAIPAGATPSQAAFQSLLYAIDGLIILEVTHLAAQARRRLRTSETRARELLELAPDAYFQANLDGRFVDVNHAACGLLGYERNDLLGKPILDIIPPEDSPRLAALRTELSTPGVVHVGEWTVLRKDGTRVPVEVSSNILPDGRWQAFARDITKRKSTEDERQVLISLLENSSDFIGIADPTGKPVYLNPAGRRMVALPDGLPIEQTKILDYYPPDERSFAENVILKAMLERGRWSGETYFRHWQTEAGIPVSDEHFMIRDPGGERILGMGTVTRDISQARQAAREREELLVRERAVNQQLRESEDRFRLTIDEAPIGMALLDLDGRFVRVNGALCEIVGYTAEELQRLNFRDITHPDDLDSDLALVERLTRGEIPRYQLEKRYIRSDGNIVWISLSASILRRADGAPLYYIAQIEDITERKRAAGALRESELKFRRLVESMPDGVFINRDGRIVYANRSFCTLLGYEEESALVGRRNEEYLSAESLKIVQERVRHMHETGQNAPPRELTMLRRDGSPTVVETVAVEASFEGAPAIVVIVRDLTERLRAEQALRFSEAKFSGIVSISADAIISVDEAQKITVFNAGAEAIFGYSRDEVLGAPIELLVPEASREVHRQVVATFGADPVTARRVGERLAVIKGRRKNGEEFPAEASISNLKLGDTRLLTVVVRDVTERDRVEKEQRALAEVGVALATSLDYEETLATVARIAVKDFADWCFVEVMAGSDEPRRLKVASKDPARDRVADQMERFQIDRARPYLTKAVLDSQEPVLIPQLSPKDLEASAQGPDHLRLLQAVAPSSMISVPLLLRQELLGTLTFVSSTPSRRYGPANLRFAVAIAERASLAIENARLYRESLRATGLRDQVLGVVAHDLRNPLNSISLHAAALQRRPPQAERRDQKHKEAIERAGRRMNRLIQDLLDVAVLEAGQLSVDKVPLSGGDLVNEAVEMQRALAAASSIELLIETAADVPRILGDRDRLLQVFENLIGNALKFTAAGGQVRVGAARGESTALFWVADTGRGMTPEDLARVFDRFWQASARRGRLGAGLGLPITKGIVEAHGGHIWAESAPGQGSRFVFEIPAASSVDSRTVEHLH